MKQLRNIIFAMGLILICATMGHAQSDFSTLPSLVTDIDVSKMTPLSDSASVTTVNDVSGNSNSVTQGTSGNRPIYRTAAGTGNINGLPCVQFTGGKYLASTGLANTAYNSGFTVYLVVRWDSNHDVYNFVAGLSSATNAGLNVEVLNGITASTNILLDQNQSAQTLTSYSASGVTFGNKTGVVNRNSNTGVIAISYNPTATNSAGGTGQMVYMWDGDSNVQTNGINGTDAASGSFFTSTAAPLYLGGGAEGSFTGGCSIGECVVTSAGESVSTVKGVSQALMTKWGIKPPNLLYANGDSITAGYEGTANLDGWFGQLVLHDITYPFHGMNFAVIGTQVANMATVATLRVDPYILNTGSAYGYAYATRNHSLWVLSGGTNDIGNDGPGSYSDEAHNIFAQLVACCQARQTANPSLKIIIGTVIARSTFNTPTLENTRQELNMLIRTASSPPWQAISDFARQNSDGTSVSASPSTLQTSAFFDNIGNTSNTTYYYTDGIHPVQAGYIAMAPAFANAYNAVINIGFTRNFNTQRRQYRLAQ